MASKKTEQIIVNTLQKYININEYQIFVFGSRATGKARKYSDYDIGIIGKKPLNLAKKSMIIADFEESNLPYRVDLVDFYTVPKSFKKIAMSKIKKIC